MAAIGGKAERMRGPGGGASSSVREDEDGAARKWDGWLEAGRYYDAAAPALADGKCGLSATGHGFVTGSGNGQAARVGKRTQASIDDKKYAQRNSLSQQLDG